MPKNKKTQPTTEQPKTTKVTVTTAPPFKARLKNIVRTMKRKPIIGVAVLMVILVGLALAIEPSRLYVMNLVSSSQTSILVKDADTGQPIDGATVQLGQQKVATNKSGAATISNVRFGAAQYTVTKENYATITTTAHVTARQQSLPTVSMKAQGVPVTVTAANTLSDAPVGSFVVKLAGTEVSAVADARGSAIIKVPTNRLGNVTFNVTADGFNVASVTRAVKRDNNETIAAKITPSGRYYFISERTGKTVVYSANYDGSDQVEVIPAGEAAEPNYSSTSLSVSPDNSKAMLVSARDNTRNAKGQRINALFMIDLKAKTIERVDEGAPTFDLVGWADNNTAAYMIFYDEYNRADNAKLKTVKADTKRLDTLLVGSYIYDTRDPSTPNRLLVSYGIGDDAKVAVADLLTKKITNVADGIAQTTQSLSPGLLAYESYSPTRWMSVDLTSLEAKEIAQPDIESYREFTRSQDESSLAWLVYRDSASTLIVGKPDLSGQRAYKNELSINNIYRYVANKYIIVNASTGNRSADYIIDITSGKVTKID